MAEPNDALEWSSRAFWGQLTMRGHSVIVVFMSLSAKATRMRLIFLSVACFCLGSFVGCSQSQPKGSALNVQSDQGTMDAGVAVEERFSERANQVAANIQSLITTEIRALPDHEWAGSYYKGDGLGENVTVLLAPKSGYLFEWHGCMGLYDRNYGNIELNNEHLRLSFAFSNIQEGVQGIADEFLPIHWGNRTYLVPANDIVGFCNDVNSGNEPRSGVHGSYLLRDGDHAKAVAGQPELSPKYRPYLLQRPINSVVTGIGNVTTRPSICEWNFKDTEVVLDAGTSDGVLPGMELFVIEPRDVVMSLKIQIADKNKSIGVITQIGADADEVALGWKLSTRPNWNQ